MYVCVCASVCVRDAVYLSAARGVILIHILQQSSLKEKVHPLSHEREPNVNSHVNLERNSGKYQLTQII